MNTSLKCMPMFGVLLSAALGSAAAVAAVPTAELTPLSIDFNDKTPGQSLGTGGADLGEPVELNQLDTLVVQSSPGEMYLQVSNDLSSNNARTVNWQFDDSAELSEGLVSVSMEFTPSNLDGYFLGIREPDGASRNFLSLDFSANGRLYANDAAGFIGEYFDAYGAGDTINIEMLFDMAARTSSVTINGTPLFTARAHGISDRGVGRLVTGYAFGSNGSAFALDNLLVLANVPLPLVLEADIDDKAPGQPIGIGGAKEGEPVYFSPAIAQQAFLLRRFNNGLRLWATAISPAQYARWEFLEDLEIRSGIVAFEMDVRFQANQRYEINVNGPLNANTVFSSIRFSPDRLDPTSGNVEIVDPRGRVRIAGRFQPNVFQHLQIVFDLDSGTYTVKLDGSVLVANERHGANTGHGISSIQTGFQRKNLGSAPMDIDNLQVGASDSPILP